LSVAFPSVRVLRVPLLFISALKPALAFLLPKHMPMRQIETEHEQKDAPERKRCSPNDQKDFYIVFHIHTMNTTARNNTSTAGVLKSLFKGQSIEVRLFR
jgi:hypothetical protein